MSLECFPSDILLKIARYLTCEEYLLLSETSKKINNCLTYGRYGSGHVNLKALKIFKLKKHIALVKANGRNIRYIVNPSHCVQLEAVRQDGHVLVWLPYATEQVQLEAIKRYGSDVVGGFCGVMTEKSQLLAIEKSDSCPIRWFKNSTMKVKLAAVRKDGYSIRYISNPSKKLQMEAVKQKQHSVLLINKPARSVIQMAKCLGLPNVDMDF